MEDYPHTLWTNNDKTRAGAFNCLTEPFKDNRCHKLVAAVFNAQLLG
jgi:hypothetical protein